MLITDKFVYIHTSKTGGTFVTEVILRLNEVKVKTRAGILARLLPGIGSRCERPLVDINARALVEIPKHAGCSQIPKDHRHKVILATIRNPYDRCVSEYEFGWWQERPDHFGGSETVKKLYPHFPNLTFEEFIDMANALFPRLRNDNFPPAESLGYQTELFARFFFKKPKKTFASIDKEYITSKKYGNDIYENVHFIHTNVLNRELYDFLIRLGYPRQHLESILDMGRLFPPEGGRTEEQKWEKYYTPELKQKVRLKERLLFEIFPEFDV
jgi:hypothetical protein